MTLFELFGLTPRPLQLDQIYVLDAAGDGCSFQTLNEERKWVKGRFDNSLGIDQPSHLHGDGQTHAHVFGRRREEIGVVNFDGTASHDKKCKLHKYDADALRLRGFNIPASNLVEWTKQRGMPGMLLG